MIDVGGGLQILVDLLEVPEIVANADNAFDVGLSNFLNYYELLDWVFMYQPNMSVRIEQFHLSTAFTKESRLAGEL